MHTVRCLCIEGEKPTPKLSFPPLASPIIIVLLIPPPPPEHHVTYFAIFILYETLLTHLVFQLL